MLYSPDNQIIDRPQESISITICSIFSIFEIYAREISLDLFLRKKIVFLFDKQFLLKVADKVLRLCFFFIYLFLGSQNGICLNNFFLLKVGVR